MDAPKRSTAVCECELKDAAHRSIAPHPARTQIKPNGEHKAKRMAVTNTEYVAFQKIGKAA